MFPVALILAWLAVVGRSTEDDGLPARIAAEHLPNAIRIHERIISGGLPEDAAAFEDLSSLGVKTIISVDGAKPNLSLSSKYGMRYIHLPHGYSGIPKDRVAELAKAVREFEGPIYIHCHHGKHRSPSAAVVACVANGMLDTQSATKILKFAGTSENYRGLYRSVENAQPIDPQVLDALESDFPEVAKLPPFAEAMVELDRVYEHLTRFASADWKSLDDHPDLEPSHEALLLSEHFTEMLRMESDAKESEEFRRMLKQSELDSRKLEALLHSRSTTRTIGSVEVNTQFDRVSANCAACHKQFRDVPLSK